MNYLVSRQCSMHAEKRLETPGRILDRRLKSYFLLVRKAAVNHANSIQEVAVEAHTLLHGILHAYEIRNTLRRFLRAQEPSILQRKSL